MSCSKFESLVAYLLISNLNHYLIPLNDAVGETEIRGHFIESNAMKEEVKHGGEGWSRKIIQSDI